MHGSEPVESEIRLRTGNEVRGKEKIKLHLAGMDKRRSVGGTGFTNQGC